MNDLSTQQPTVEAIQQELRHYLLALSILLNDFYGEHALRAVLKEEARGQTDWQILANADVSPLRLCKLLPEAYDFAFNGRMSDVMEDQAFASPSYFDQLDGFLQMLESNELIEGVWNDPAIVDRESKLGGLRLLTDTGIARAMLYQGENLHSKQIALLSGIAERSVQNAFSAKGAGRLKAEKFGNVSYVSADEARRWLADKKGFIPTTHIRFSDDGTLPETLNSQAELRAFLLPRIEKRFGPELESFTVEIGMSYDEASRKLTGVQRIELSDAVAVAKALKLDSKWLVAQIFRINYPQEASLFLTA